MYQRNIRIKEDMTPIYVFILLSTLLSNCAMISPSRAKNGNHEKGCKAAALRMPDKNFEMCPRQWAERKEEG
jgi:hypothetical protein